MTALLRYLDDKVLPVFMRLSYHSRKLLYSFPKASPETKAIDVREGKRFNHTPMPKTPDFRVNMH